MTSRDSSGRKGRAGRSAPAPAGAMAQTTMARGSLTSALARAQHSPELCVFRHVSRTMRAIARRYDRALQEAGLTGNQFTLLMTLAHRGQLTVGTLAAQLDSDPSTVPRLLRPLVDLGDVTVRVGRDRRARLVGITAAGTRHLAGALQHWDRVQEEMIAGIGDGRWKAIIGNLRVLREVVAADSPDR